MRTEPRELPLRLPHLLMAVLMLLMLAPACAGDNNIWAYVDADGVTSFSNIPDAASPYRLYLKDPDSYRLKGSRSEGVAATKDKAVSWRRSVPLDKLPYSSLVASVAAEYQLDAALLHAIIHVESRHNATAVSPKGALGLMQVLPETARRMGVSDAMTPQQNVVAGARYMRFLLDTFDRNTQLALAAYNAGENAVIRHGNRIPPYPETQAYVPAVIETYNALIRKQRTGS